MNCPCGRENTYTQCCGKIHESMLLAITAEDLMRSRYVAFTMANGDYLMQSHHSSTRPINEKTAVEKWAKSVKWLRLEILNTTLGTKTDVFGTVEFKAYFQEKGKEQCIHENSKFSKEYGKWMYVSAF